MKIINPKPVSLTVKEVILASLVTIIGLCIFMGLISVYSKGI